MTYSTAPFTNSYALMLYSTSLKKPSSLWNHDIAHAHAARFTEIENWLSTYFSH